MDAQKIHDELKLMEIRLAELQREVDHYAFLGQENANQYFWGGRTSERLHAAAHAVSSARIAVEVTFLPQGDYAKARGVVPVGPDALSPEEAIRRGRNDKEVF